MFTGFVGHRELFKGVINDLNNFKEYYLCRRNSGRKLGDLKEKLTVKWGEEGWEHVLACNPPQKFFYYSPLILSTPQFPTAASYVLEVLLHYSELWSIHLQAVLCHQWFCAHDASPYMRWALSLSCENMYFKVNFSKLKFCVIIIEGENILQHKYINEMNSS